MRHVIIKFQIENEYYDRFTTNLRENAEIDSTVRFVDLCSIIIWYSFGHSSFKKAN